jgi:hypothetical protein
MYKNVLEFQVAVNTGFPYFLNQRNVEIASNWVEIGIQGGMHDSGFRIQVSGIRT